MWNTFFQMGFALIEGFALIISPCILPILPIILAGSITGDKKRPFGIIISFVIIFSLFTFFSRKLIQVTHIDISLIRHIAYFILVLFGIIMLSTYLTEQFNRLTNRLVNVGQTLTVANNSEGGFVSGLLFGGLVAIIWTPCAGPILAAIIVQTVIQQSDYMGFLLLIAFAIGAGIPMLIIALFGRAIMENLNFFKKHTLLFRKMVGIIIILSVFYMIYSERTFYSAYASENTNLSGIRLENGLTRSYAAPPIQGITAWINSPPLQLEALKGKVVLIDFWTYSCINCIRTLPYLKNWYKQYHDKGLIIIGVHSPEFPFEKDLNNVKNAVKGFGLLYPIALDNQFVTWQNYNNAYWPAHYLIDKNGEVVYTHFGEGDYDITENNIRYLLGLSNKTSTSENGNDSFSSSQTPETYLGFTRATSFASPEQVTNNKPMQYTFPIELPLNQWALQGNWTIAADRIISNNAPASIKIHFYARKVFIVMGSSTHNAIQTKILLNGKKITIDQGREGITVKKHQLYTVVTYNHPDEGLLEVIALSPGLEIYTFTFG